MQHQRIYYTPNLGTFDCNLQWDAVGVDSRVIATIAEAREEGVSVGGRDGRRFLGLATMTVHNVVPHERGVTIRVTIAWDEPLWFAVDYFLFD